MSLVSTTIMGNDLVLGSHDDPPVGHRVGSVPVKFDNGKTEYISVFGSIHIYTDSRERDHFESELRKFCQDPDTVQKVLGVAVQSAHAKRFNPSRSQTDRGYYRAGRNGNVESHQRSL
jgi:hypothetical protein